MQETMFSRKYSLITAIHDRFFTGFHSGSLMYNQCGNFSVLPISDKQDPLLRVAHCSESYCRAVDLFWGYGRNLAHFRTTVFNYHNHIIKQSFGYYFNIKFNSFTISYLFVISAANTAVLTMTSSIKIACRCDNDRENVAK